MAEKAILALAGVAPQLRKELATVAMNGSEGRNTRLTVELTAFCFATSSGSNVRNALFALKLL